MASYLSGNLLDGETVRYRASISLWRYGPRLVLGALIDIAGLALLVDALAVEPHRSALAIGGAVLLVIGAVVLAKPLILRRSTELAITDRRVICKSGLLSTSSIEIRFNKIETVRVHQELLGRLLNYGDVEIRGTGTSFEPIEGIARPLAFKNALDQAMESYRPPAAAGPLGT